MFPPEEWLVGASLPSKYAPERINMILNQLSPERVSNLMMLKFPVYSIQYILLLLDSRPL
ncbi:hypothetical protein ACP4OV_019136 [Aristida adscensionis]